MCGTDHKTIGKVVSKKRFANKAVDKLNIRFQFGVNALSPYATHIWLAIFGHSTIFPSSSLSSQFRLERLATEIASISRE